MKPASLLLPLCLLAFAGPASAHQGEVACNHDGAGVEDDDRDEGGSCKQARKENRRDAVQACNAGFRATDCAPGDGVCRREAAHELGACKRAARAEGPDCKVRDPHGKKNKKEKHGKRGPGQGGDRPAAAPAGDDQPAVTPTPAPDEPAPAAGPAPSRPPPPRAPKTKLPARV